MSQLLSKTKTAPKIVATAKRSNRNFEIVNPSTLVSNRLALSKLDDHPTISSLEAHSTSKRPTRNLELVNQSSVVTNSATLANKNEASTRSLTGACDDTVSSSPSIPVTKKRLAHPVKRPHPEPVECFPIVPRKKKTSTHIFDVADSLKPMGVVKPQNVVSPRRSPRIIAKSADHAQPESNIEFCNVDTGNISKPV